MKNKALFTLITLAGILTSCRSNESAPPHKAALARHSTGLTKQVDDCEDMRGLFFKEDRLSYGGYEVVKLRKKVKLREMAMPIEVSYVVVRKDGKQLAKFDGLYHGAGNATSFGLLPLLGGEQKQLVVSQTIPRGGWHWVATLSPGFRVIFDSSAFKVSAEDFCIKDVNTDGVKEISLRGGNLFIYDEKAGKYLRSKQ